MCRNSLENMTYEFVPASLAGSSMSSSSYLDSLLDGGKWLYTCCIEECCFQDLFKIVHSILNKHMHTKLYFKIDILDKNQHERKATSFIYYNNYVPIFCSIFALDFEEKYVEFTNNI